jgi:hypothetical protein
MPIDTRFVTGRGRDFLIAGATAAERNALRPNDHS